MTRNLSNVGIVNDSITDVGIYSAEHGMEYYEQSITPMPALPINEQLLSSYFDANIFKKEYDGLQALLSVLNTSWYYPDAARDAINTLYQMSRERDGRSMICENNGINALLRFLPHNDEDILLKTISTLHNLLLYQDGAKTDIRLAGGLEKMVALLRIPCVKFLAVLTDCLRLLTSNHEESKRILLTSAAALSLLVGILRDHDDVKLLFTTTRLFKQLSSCASEKISLVLSGCMQALANFLTHQNIRLVRNCLWTLRNLSDVATKQDGLEGLLHLLVQHLSSNDLNVVTCAAGILSNLTCNNPKNKQVVYHAGGIEALLKAIKQAEHCQPITEPVVCTLRHLTSRHSFAKHSGNQIRMNHGISMLIRLLRQLLLSQQTAWWWSLMKATTGLIKNLALNPDNHACVQDHIKLLLHLFIRTIFEMQQKVLDRVHVVDMETIIENILGTLASLSGKSLSQQISEDQHCLSVLVSLLYYHKESVAKATSDILNGLIEDNMVAKGVTEQDGVLVGLTDLLQSPNEAEPAKLTCLFKEELTMDSCLVDDFIKDSQLWDKTSPSG